MDTYEKKYNEALELAKFYHGNYPSEPERKKLEKMFPELRESEDERVIKALEAFINQPEIADKITFEARIEWLSWLEKQKEQPTDAKTERVIKASRRVLNNWLDGGDNPDVSGDFTELEYAIREYDGEKKQKEPKPIKVYRVENEDKQKGLWRKFDGTWEPLFDMLTDGLCRNLPMQDSDLYRAEGKKWFASAPSRETLQKWFSKRDLEELTAAGFTISEFEVTNYKKVSEFEYIFTRDSIINRTYLSVSDIYPEQKPAEWNDADMREARNNLISVCRDWERGEKTTLIPLGAVRARYFLEHLTEPKPAECIEDSVKFEEGFKTGRESGLRDGQKYVLDNAESYGLCKPAEWSEEDEKDVAHIIRILDDCYDYGRHDLSKTDHENLVNKLKSLRPQPHWKPSEEQMEAFRGYIEDFQARAEAAVGGWNNFDVMIRLYEHLKKL